MPNKIIKLNSFSDFESFAAANFSCTKARPERREPGIFEKGVPYSERLKTYLEYSRACAHNEFIEMTCGIGATATFRKCLKDYIKSFEPQKVFADSEAKISLHSDGVFAIEGEDKGGGNNFCLEILSYFNLMGFWDEIEEIRNFNYTKNPIIITGIASGDLKIIEKLSQEILKGREVIYIAEPLCTDLCVPKLGLTLVDF